MHNNFYCKKQFLSRQASHWSALLVILLFLSGCSTTSYTRNHSLSYLTNARHSQPNRYEHHSLNKKDRARLTKVAQSALGKSRLKVGNNFFRNDCSGTIRAIFSQANIRLGGIIKNSHENDVKAIYRFVQKYGTITKKEPKAGDLIFFHNTYDRSRNGKMNDALTHIGIVEKIKGTTIHFIHHLGKAIIRSRMDLSKPNAIFHPKTKERINHILRRAQGKHRAYTSAELFAGFGRL